MDDEVERLLSAARADLRTGAGLPKGLIDRVLQDAYDLQPAGQPVKGRGMTPARGPGWRQRLAAAVAALGGLPGVSGLGTAAVIGVAVGYGDPTSADWLAQGLSVGWATEVDLLSADSLFLTEG